MGGINVTHVWGTDGSPYRPLVLLVVVVLPWLLLETWRSRRNEAALRAAGALEPSDDVIGWMRVAYPGLFVAMTFEGLWSVPSAFSTTPSAPVRP